MNSEEQRGTTRTSTVVTSPSNETTSTSSTFPTTIPMPASTDNFSDITGSSTIAETVAPSIQTTLGLIHTPMITTTSQTIKADVTQSLVPTTEVYVSTTEHSASLWTSTPEHQTLTTTPTTQASTTMSMFPTSTPSTTASTQSMTSSTTKVITSTAEYESDSTTPYPNTTVYTTTPTTTTLPPDISTITMKEKTTYMYENASLDCSVKHAVRWQSLSIRVDQNWRPLEVTVHPSGLIKWSRSKKSRHLVTYDIKDSTDGRGSDISVSLIISNVKCNDAQTFICTLISAYPEKEAKSKLVVVGKPSDSIKLTMGPSMIEDKALRITASWQGGYPVPWTNMSWIAIDPENKSYNLEEYGQYRDGELHEDHSFCQTTMERSIVIFPKLHLNGTRIVVKPDIHGKRYFVDKEMETYLLSVQPGEDKILVIPNDYCGVVEKEKSIAHPYTACSKFVRCLPGDMVVQLCPFGTCFYEDIQECA